MFTSPEREGLAGSSFFKKLSFLFFLTVMLLALAVASLVKHL